MNIASDHYLQRDWRAWAPLGKELAGQAGLETVSKETAAEFSFCGRTL